jgi:mRNA deadenylase 3'-5' endonuclease subunit Ccr4
MNISVDSLFPSETNKSGTRGKKLDVETLFSNTPLNNEPDITFSSSTLLERRKKRRKEKLNHFKQMLKYCHKKIADTDEDQGTDIVFSVVESIPECKDYNPLQCLEYISIKLREEDFDTTILTNTTMFITWKYLELKVNRRKSNQKDHENEKNEKNEKNKDDRENKDTQKKEEKNTKEITINKNNLDDELFL